MVLGQTDSSLTRIRDCFGEDVYRAIFERLILKWKETGLVKGKSVIANVSLVEVDANFDSLVERTDADPDCCVLRQYERHYHDFRQGK